MTDPLPSTESLWRERVAAWRASGQTALQFADGRGFAPATLRYWSSRLARSAAPPPFVRLVPRSAPAAPVAKDASLIVEVRDARIRVAPGFDPALLARVVRALQSDSP